MLSYDVWANIFLEPITLSLNKSECVFKDEKNFRNIIHRGMDRIRRSFRESFRWKTTRDQLGRDLPREQSPANSAQPSGSGAPGMNADDKAELWQPDEAAVRSGTCSFNVKYLGCIEVFESRGMQVCEGALKLLRNQRRKPVKSILYVSGDGLRVVDQENNRGLIVDQTIEKVRVLVSFCAPDRNHEKGFAYICRDGTSRRWMCHGFLAIKETGERLSHAVGCAFAVCLERKKKRDAEAISAVHAAAGLQPIDTALRNRQNIFEGQKKFSGANSTYLTKGQNSAYGSFRRQLSITERLQDPQSAIVQEPPSRVAEHNDLRISAKPRPLANPLLFERHGSLRAPDSSTAAATAFRRQFSLRSYSDSPSKSYRTACCFNQSDAIAEGEEETSSQNLGDMSNKVESLTLISKINDESLDNIANEKYSGRSKADEWLEQTFRSSLSVNSPLKNFAETPRTDFCRAGPPPSQPPPPLPPAYVLATSRPQRQELLPVVESVKFSSDYSKYELPPITEAFSSVTEVNVQSPAVQAMDVFGQPIFNPVSQFSSANSCNSRMFNGKNCTISGCSSSGSTLENSFSNCSHVNIETSCIKQTGSVSSSNQEGYDPFNVKWSQMAIASSISFNQTSVKSTNPFHCELNTLKT
ncbi:unnamed protein product [Dracunculus medinensis]|uniref:PID domain-containing protein n=1 Tax=Dracunculus medinensis TaxID=318479 RepID=A0A0N4UPL4_DRAME|nr:unnamed protein product [Dracunculus medinensis]